MFTASSRSSCCGAAIFSVQNLGRRRKNRLDYIFSLFAHFWQTDSVQVNIVVVPFDCQNLLNMTRLKQWIRVIVQMLKITCILSITYFTCNKVCHHVGQGNSGRSVGSSATISTNQYSAETRTHRGWLRHYHRQYQVFAVFLQCFLHCLDR